MKILPKTPFCGKAIRTKAELLDLEAILGALVQGLTSGWTGWWGSAADRMRNSSHRSYPSTSPGTVKELAIATATGLKRPSSLFCQRRM